MQSEALKKMQLIAHLKSDVIKWRSTKNNYEDFK